MKTKKRYLWLSIVFMLSQINVFAQNNVVDTTQFAIKAIKEAVIRYHEQKYVGYYEYMVITLKIMRINKTSGEFVLNYIKNDPDYDYLQPTHFVHVNNELVLIKVDSMCKTNPEKYEINKITEVTKKEALDILAGPNLVITGQIPPYMKFIYKKNEIEGVYYNPLHLPPRKYWF